MQRKSQCDLEKFRKKGAEGKEVGGLGGRGGLFRGA